MDDDKCSLELLPVDLQLVVLGKLGWTALATLACASKHFRGLVRDMNAQPIWNTELSQELPDYEVDIFRLFALGVHLKSIHRAVYFTESTIVGRMLSKLKFPSRPDLCLVFATPTWAEQGDTLREVSLLNQALRVLLPSCCSIVISFGDGITGRSGASGPLELVAGDEGISISLLHLPPGVELSIAYQPHNSNPVAGKLPASGSKGVHFFQVAACMDAQQQALKMLTSRFPDSIVVGGTLDLGPDGSFDDGGVVVSIAPQHWGAEAANPEALMADQLAGRFMMGAVVIGFIGPNVEVHPVSIRGILPEPEGFRVDRIVFPASPKYKASKQTDIVAVTKVVRVVDEHGRLGFRPKSAEQTREAAAEQMASFSHMAYADQYRHRSFVVYHRTPGDFHQEFEFTRAVRITRGSVSLAAELEPGSVICSGQQQGEQNKEDWMAALTQVKQQLPLSLPQCQAGGSFPPDAMRPHPVLGAFYTACCSRGWPLYTPEEDRRTARRLNVETTMFDRIFPGAPIAGFGAMGELGPPPVRERFDGSAKVKELALTTVAAIICLKPERRPDM